MVSSPLLLLIRPGAGISRAAAYVPLGAACLHALYRITTRKVSTAAVTPFGDTMALWATRFGLVLSADLAPAWTVAGALVIVLGGLYVLRRERLRRGAGRPRRP